MKSVQPHKNWKPTLLLWGVGLAVTLVISAVTRLWVLTAIPVGFLFGFFLEKADLCGASAFSEMIMMKDREKFWGLCTVIVVSMIGFALLSALGWVKLNPKPLIWANYIVGGIAFGIGSVLAGGCISGCLFKSGQGNINSMAGLVGIALGVAAVLHGPLQGFEGFLKQFIIKNADHSSVTFSSVTGLPYWVLALLFGVIAVIFAAISKNKPQAPATVIKKEDLPALERIVTRSWRPWQAGIAVRVLACFAHLSSAASGRELPPGSDPRCFMPVANRCAVKPRWLRAKGNAAFPQKGRPCKTGKCRVACQKVSCWLILEVIFLVAGSFTSAKLSGKIRFLPRPPDQTVVAFWRYSSGCGSHHCRRVRGGQHHERSGAYDVGNVLFLVTVVLANWATTSCTSWAAG
ncbi:MAG: YeeE/YedE family protein [Desulfobacterales bacterium]